MQVGLLASLELCCQGTRISAARQLYTASNHEKVSRCADQLTLHKGHIGLPLTFLFGVPHAW